MLVPQFAVRKAIDAPIDGFKNPLPTESIHNECSACVGQIAVPFTVQREPPRRGHVCYSDLPSGQIAWP